MAGEALLAVFVCWWFRRWLRKHGDRYDPFGVTVDLRRQDWRWFLQDSSYLLAAGYTDLAVSSVAGQLIFTLPS